MVALERFASTLAAGPHEPDELPRRFTTIATATIGVATPPPSHPAAPQPTWAIPPAASVARMAAALAAPLSSASTRTWLGSGLLE